MSREQWLDRIFISELCVPCHVGVSEEERSVLQNVIIDITVFTPLKPSGTSDNLKDTIDYDELAGMIHTTAQNKHYYLLEHLAEKTTACILQHRLTQGVRLR